MNTSWYRWGALCAFCLSALPSRVALAQSEDLALPSPEQSAVVATAASASMAEFSAASSRGEASASSCTLDAQTRALSCADVRMPQSCAKSWEPGIALRDLVVRSDDSAWWVREAVVTDVGLMMTDVVWLSPTGRLLHADAALLSGERLELREPRWMDGAPQLVEACPARPTLPSAIARASGAAFDGERWTLEGVRVGPWPLGSPGRPELGASGLLPPTIRAFGDPDAGSGDPELAAEVQAYYWLAPFAALTLLADTSGRIGGGATVITEHRESLSALDLTAVYDADERVLRPLVAGDVFVGDERHFRGHFEHPIDAWAWQARRLEHGGFFRDWRFTNAGLSLGGAGHALAAEVGYVTDPQVLDPVLSGGFHYGTRFDGDFSDWNVVLRHVSLSDADTVHDSTAAVDFGVPIGSRNRAYVRPGAGVVANYGTVTARRGFDASTTISFLGTVEAGLAFEGRFERARHHVAPRLRLGVEAFGTQQRQAEEGAPPFAYTQPDRWRYAHLLLDQRIELGGWSFAMPAGVLADALGEESIGEGLGDARPHASVGWLRDEASVQLQTVCADGCASVQLGAFGRIRARRGVMVTYGFSELDEEAMRVLYADNLLVATGTAVHLVQVAAERIVGFSHVAGIEVASGPLSAQLQGRWAAIDPAGRGVSSRLGWSFGPLGWGLGLGAGLRLDGEWAATAGLTLR